LDFQHFNFSTVRTVKRVELHHYAKFCRNLFNRGQDIAIFSYFKMAAAAILDFQNLKFFNGRKGQGVKQHHCAKFRRNRLNRGRDMVIFDFLRWRPRHFGFSKFRIFNGLRRHECQTASPFQISSKSFEPRQRYVSFNIMLVWLEIAYSRPFLEFFGGTFPPNDVTHRPNRKTTILGLNHVI